MRRRWRVPGYSMVFWACFIALVLLPLLALAIEVGRYSFARAEVAKAADAAALAAAIEIDRSVFRETGLVVVTPQAWAEAQAYASLNTGYLSSLGVHAMVTGIEVDNGNRTVEVVVSANLERLFPSIIPNIMVSEVGLASVRAETLAR
ncbi:MAG: pilus assembly protein TadG-related protein [Anaerolineales bacterium]